MAKRKKETTGWLIRYETKDTFKPGVWHEAAAYFPDEVSVSAYAWKLEKAERSWKHVRNIRKVRLFRRV